MKLQNAIPVSTSQELHHSKLDPIETSPQETEIKEKPTSVTLDGVSLWPISRSEFLCLDWKSDYKDPERFQTRDQVEKFFYEVQRHDISDVLILEGKPILVRKQGILYGLTRRLIDKDEALVFLIHTTVANAEAEINSGKSLNSAYSIFHYLGKANRFGETLKVNFRVNASGITVGSRASFEIVMRAIPSSPPHYDDVGLTQSFVHKCCPVNGWVLIAGETGSGKSTTLASMIREILEGNTPIKGNILTHEEPIEFTYENISSKHSIVAQSQIPENFKDFLAANREAMRRKPAAVLVGELRDQETISAALELAMTGHPVFGTVHASDVSNIIQRMVSRFPDSGKQAAVYDMVDSIRVLIAQRLVMNVKTGKQFAVREHLILTEKMRYKLKQMSDPETINKHIQSLMMNSTGKNPNISKTFSKQAEELRNEGIIDEAGYIKLCVQQVDENEDELEVA